MREELFHSVVLCALQTETLRCIRNVIKKYCAQSHARMENGIVSKC